MLHIFSRKLSLIFSLCLVVSVFMLSACLNTSTFRGDTSSSTNSPAHSAPQAKAPSTPEMKAPPAQSSMEGICLALALPRSGERAAQSQSIHRGAELAKQKLAKQGVKVHLQYVDTTQSSWLTSLRALPAQCAVVGGILEPINFTRAQNAKITNSRNFFAFLPTLPSVLGHSEGVSGWRLFPSTQDEARTLLDFGKALGLQSFGTIYEEDSYGKNMYASFRALAPRAPVASYSANNVDAWNSAAQRLLKPQGHARSLDAIFVPGSLKHLDGIGTAIFNHGGKNSMLFGSSRWRQDRGFTPPNVQKFALAIFPDAINPDNLPSGINNFWSALGHDFVELGARLALTSYTSATMLNTKLQNIPKHDFAMAPIAWDAQGRARQQMHVFRIGKNGQELTSVDEMQGIRAKVLGLGTVQPISSAKPADKPAPVTSRPLTPPAKAQPTPTKNPPAAKPVAPTPAGEPVLPTLDMDKKQTFTTY